MEVENRRILDAEAARTGRSISELIRDAVMHTYGHQADTQADLAAIEAALGTWVDRDHEAQSMSNSSALGVGSKKSPHSECPGRHLHTHRRIARG